ncbi:hypothetical protein GRAN_4871 [Granulicella sibirica]|uniref:Uncharacterized protein n=1 Tax=Granulicella sibirica TaxID=2479048 RepID=A0A4Q0SWC8_9BACT|nr:hypothetical protein GRAN_4871 [Granulicella sibirica]
MADGVKKLKNTAVTSSNAAHPEHLNFARIIAIPASTK